MRKLFIGNKNYSSWSMRPWVLMRQTGIAFEEVLVRFDAFDSGSQSKQALAGLSPTGKVPVLQDGALIIWDTLAIAEYLADIFPEKPLWPQAVAARARARSVCAEMHAGFTSLRSHCQQNIEASLPEVGALIWRDQPAVRADVARLVVMWSAWPRCRAWRTGSHRPAPSRISANLKSLIASRVDGPRGHTR